MLSRIAADDDDDDDTDGDDANDDDDDDDGDVLTERSSPNALDNPKSHRRTTLLSVSSTFAGLTSPCTIPLLCTYLD